MARFTIFLVQRESDGTIKTQSGITSAFLQPQPNASSANPSTKSADSDSIALTQAGTNLGQWYADISNPVPRYDLYINNSKQSDFSGASGFEISSSKSIFIKKDVLVVATAVTVAESFVTGSGKLATPDGGQTWPKFSDTNLPHVIISAPSETADHDYHLYRDVKIVRGTIAVVSGNLQFSLTLDPNGPDLDAYYCDIMIVLL